MNIINLTPHSISLYSSSDVEEQIINNYMTLVLKEGAQPLAVYPSQGVARATSRKVIIDRIEVNGVQIPVHHTAFGKAEGLPPATYDTYYIVSALTAQACPDRTDLIIVDSTVRDNNGRIVGCTAFGKV